MPASSPDADCGFLRSAPGNSNGHCADFPHPLLPVVILRMPVFGVPHEVVEEKTAEDLEVVTWKPSVL
jgi:hypothetical protein